ncbi:CHAT domain-containing protein [Streptomyces sp. NBC_01615]|uniref:CHAT domain-containing protein n=1 Tax=Streptomyces sp. NBC_01615 TaxID=2975898 RepID=UPI00386EE224
MSGLWQRIGAARDEQELLAALPEPVEREQLVAHLLRLADTLEERAFAGSLLRVLELADLAGGGPAVIRRRDALLAIAELARAFTDDTVAAADRAAANLSEAGEYVRAVDTLLSTARALLDHGRTEQTTTRLEQALNMLQDDLEPLAAARSAPGLTLRPGAQTAHGLVQLCDELSQTEPSPRTAVVIARFGAMLREAGVEEFRILSAIQLGSVLVRLGEAESGIQMLRDALKGTLRGDHGHESLERGRLWLAAGMHRTGRCDQALDALRTHSWWRSDDPERRAQVSALAVRVLIDEGRLTEALDLLAEPLEHELSRAQRALVDTLLRRTVTGRPDPGCDDRQVRRTWLERDILADPRADSLQERLAELAEAGDPDLSRLRGDLALARGEPQAALDHFDAALEALLSPVFVDGWREPWLGRPVRSSEPFIRVSDARDARRGRGLGAELWLRKARAQEALGLDCGEALKNAIAGAALRNQHATLFAALLAEARRKESTGAPSAEWRADLERAADIQEGLRARLRDEELQLHALTDQDLVYERLLRAAFEAGDLDGALRTLERAKARALLDRASATSAGPLELSLADRDEARALRTRVVRGLSRKLTDPWAPDELGPALQRLAAVYRRRRPPSVSARAAATPGQVRRLATGGTLLLHYFCSGGRITLVPMYEGSGTPIPALDITPEDVGAYLEVWAGERQVRGTPHSLTELYQGLLAPVEDRLEQALRVLVIPHGVLHSVPFPALRRRDGTYLVERLPVTYAPNAAMAARAGERLAVPESGQLSLAFGLELAAYVPLGALTCVNDELDAVARALPGLRRLDHADASREALLSLDGQVNVLHFACHGEFDPDDALLSRLYLSDGPVYGYELIGLQFRPRLVVFSACETGRHDRLPGDEVMGLVRPFLGLGAGAVVATLWDVPDASTTELMTVFYAEYAARSHDPAAALRRAQLSLLGSRRFAHPHYWGPYVAIGGVQHG